MENYTQACRQRLKVWISPEVEVETAHLEIVVRFQAKRLILNFEPRDCSWAMSGACEFESSNFDQVLKKARQALTRGVQAEPR